MIQFIKLKKTYSIKIYH